MSDKEFPEGISAKRHDKAPDFVLCNVSVNKVKFIEWLADRDDWVNFSVKRARSGKIYMEVDNWRPQNPAQSMPERMSPEETPRGGLPEKDFFDDDVPF